MTHLLLRAATSVLLWLLGRQPPTRARRALAWAAAVIACAVAVEAGVLAAALAVAWWLLAQLAALLAGAGVALALAVAALAVARRGLRRVPMPAALTDPPAPDGALAGSSDTSAGVDVAPAVAGPRGSSDIDRSSAAPPVAATAAAFGPQPAEPDPGSERGVDCETAAVEPPDDPRPAVEDPLAAEAAWLEAHWADEPSRNGSAPPAGAPASD